MRVSTTSSLHFVSRVPNFINCCPLALVNVKSFLNIASIFLPGSLSVSNSNSISIETHLPRGKWETRLGLLLINKQAAWSFGTLIKTDYRTCLTNGEPTIQTFLFSIRLSNYSKKTIKNCVFIIKPASEQPLLAQYGMYVICIIVIEF